LTEAELDRLMSADMLRASPILSLLLSGDPPADRIRQRAKKLMQMARYARAGLPDELLGWGNVDVVRFNELYAALEELGAEEGPLKALAEMG